MLLSLTTVAFASSEKTINYVSLGASSTWGFGLPYSYPSQFYEWTGSQAEIDDWNENKWNAKTWNPLFIQKTTNIECGTNDRGLDVIVEGAFPSLIKSAIEKQGYKVNLSQLALSTCRTNDVLMFLDDDFQADDYANALINSNAAMYDKVISSPGEDGYELLKNRYRNDLSKADLISYDLGNGNFGMSLYYVFREDGLDYDYHLLLNDEEYAAFETLRVSIKIKVDALLNARGINPENLSSIEALIDGLTYCFLGYCTTFDRTMDWIYTNNPDVTVVVMQIQNMIKDAEYKVNGIELPVGEVINILISMANTYASSYSKYADKYYYARITDDQRTRFFIDDFLEYEGPEDLSESLKWLLDVFDIPTFPTRIKSDFGAVYESFGHETKDAQYEDALNNVYDAYIKFTQALCKSDYEYAIDNRIWYMNVMEGFIDIKDTLLTEATESFFKGEDNSVAVQNALDSFDKLDEASQKTVMFYLLFYYCGNGGMNHPSYEGHQQMADAVIETLELDERGMTSILKGVKNGFLDIFKANVKIGSYVLDYAKQLLQDLPEKIKEDVTETIESIPETVKTHVTEKTEEITANIKKQVKNKINKAIGKTVEIIMAFTK